MFKNKHVVKYMEDLEYKNVYIDWVNTGPREDKGEYVRTKAGSNNIRNNYKRTFD